MSRSLIGPIFFIAFASFADPAQPVALATTPLKCCDDGLVLSDDFHKCIQVEDALYEVGYQQILDELDFAANASRLKTCFQENDSEDTDDNHTSITSNAFATCIDFQKNGSLVYLECWNMSKRSEKDQCDTIFNFIYIYGAKMMVFANIIYLFVYSPVLLIYIIIPGVCRRAYDKVVLTFVLSQIILSCVVISLGHFLLCHIPLNKMATIAYGISLQALTIASVCLLLIISFDVASTITKFRWAPSSGTKGRDENHKFRVYMLWVFIGTFLPTSISAILQFSPITDENILHPNFHKMSGTGLNYRIAAHTLIVPLLVAVASNVLFIYTTVKMINVQRSSSLANENRKASVKKKYILYLKLYLLMDAPYITGALGSSYEDLWLLKFCRIVQPIFLCYAVIPRNIIRNLFSCKQKPQDAKENFRENAV